MLLLPSFFYTVAPSCPSVSLEDRIHTLFNRHPSIMRLHASDARRVEHRKQFAQCLVECLGHHSDGSLFSVMRVASWFPADVVDHLFKADRVKVLQQKVGISEEAASRCAALLARTRVAADSRDYESADDAAVLGYYEREIQRLVDALEKSSAAFDGTILPVLTVACEFPLDVQEMAVTFKRFRAQMMRCLYSRDLMDQWSCLVHTGRLAQLDPDSVAHMQSGLRSGRLLVDLLSKQQPDVDSLANTMRLFPERAVYAAIVTRREGFFRAFDWLGGHTDVHPRVRREEAERILDDWVVNFTPAYGRLHDQLNCVRYLRWSLSVYRTRIDPSDGFVTVSDFLSKRKSQKGKKRKQAAKKRVNYTLMLFNPRYIRMVQRGNRRFLREMRRRMEPKLAHLYRRFISRTVVQMVVAHKAVAIAALADDALVGRVRSELQAVHGPATRDVAAFLELTASLDVAQALEAEAIEKMLPE